MILPTVADKAEILEMNIVIQCDEVEKYDLEESQNVNRCGLDVFADNLGAFLITSVLLEARASVGFCQSHK